MPGKFWTQSWNPVIGCYPIIGTLDWINRPIRRHKPSVYTVAWLGDLFYEPDYITETYDIMLQSPQHQFLVLTKRPKDMKYELDKYDYIPSSNVWHGVSVSRQKDIKERVEPLLEIPGKRWLCIEPILEHIEIPHHILQHIDWVVVGVETGPNARKINPSWMIRIMDSCIDTKVPVWTKAIPVTVGADRLKLHQAPQAIAEILKTDKKIMKEVGKIDTLEGP